jgi:NADH-quinone oxidoreductase subunit K
MMTLSTVLIFNALLFSMGLVGSIINRNNLLHLLICVELLLLAVNANFITFAYYLHDIAAQIFVFFILTVAAAEAAIGLAIMILIFRHKKTIFVQDLNSLKG